MFAKLSVTVCSLALVTGLVAAAAPAEAAPTPSKITGVRAVPGPGAGQVTISWQTDGRNTSGYRVSTGLTSFSYGSRSSVRHARSFAVAKSRRSITLSAAQTRAAGAGAGTGNVLYLRLSAVNGGTTRAYPYLQTVMPKPVAPKASGTDVRVASFNVRTARATSDRRSWLKRAPEVARQIKDRNPGVVALQELGPGRADGRKTQINGTARQTTSLTSTLRRIGAGKYRLVRSTAYVKPGTSHATQGTRILYDTSRYTLVSHCPENTGKKAYNPSCSMDMPVLASDSANDRRSAAYAQFESKRTGKRFWVASVHLDQRHSGNRAKERRYNDLRARQVAAVHARVAALNTRGVPVIVAGDINSWQNNAVGNAPHEYLVSRGYYDTVAARTRVNAQYPTINHNKTRLQPAGNGYGVRIDVILVRGAQGAKRYENVMKVNDATRPSDHNMVVSDLVL